MSACRRRRGPREGPRLPPGAGAARSDDAPHGRVGVPAGAAARPRGVRGSRWWCSRRWGRTAWKPTATSASRSTWTIWSARCVGTRLAPRPEAGRAGGRPAPRPARSPRAAARSRPGRRPPPSDGLGRLGRHLQRLAGGEQDLAGQPPLLGQHRRATRSPGQPDHAAGAGPDLAGRPAQQERLGHALQELLHDAVEEAGEHAARRPRTGWRATRAPGHPRRRAGPRRTASPQRHGAGLRLPPRGVRQDPGERLAGLALQRREVLVEEVRRPRARPSRGAVRPSRPGAPAPPPGEANWSPSAWTTARGRGAPSAHRSGAAQAVDLGGAEREPRQEQTRAGRARPSRPPPPMLRTRTRSTGADGRGRARGGGPARRARPASRRGRRRTGPRSGPRRGS